MSRQKSAGWSKRLTERTAALGWSIEDLARRVGRSGSGVGHWAAGRREPALADVERLALALGVTPCWLAFGDGEAPDTPALDERLLAACVEAVAAVAADLGRSLTAAETAKLVAFTYSQHGEMQAGALRQLLRVFL